MNSSLHQKKCIICLKIFLTREDNETPPFAGGFGLCQECNDLFQQGYIALVEADPEKSKLEDGMNQPKNMHYTGQMIHIPRKEVADIMNLDLDEHHALIYVLPGVVSQIKERSKEIQAEMLKAQINPKWTEEET